MHISASPGYASGTIALNFTWMERGFNSLLVKRIADIGQKLQLFPTPLAFNAPVRGVYIGILGKSLFLRKLESWGYLADSVKTV